MKNPPLGCAVLFAAFLAIIALAASKHRLPRHLLLRENRSRATQARPKRGGSARCRARNFLVAMPEVHWRDKLPSIAANFESNWDARRISPETTNYWNYETNSIDSL